MSSVDGDGFTTLGIGKFPRIIDDSINHSSDEDSKKRDHIEKLSKIANIPKDVNLLKDYRLPIMTAHTDMKFEVEDSSEEDADEEDDIFNQNKKEN